MNVKCSKHLKFGYFCNSLNRVSMDLDQMADINSIGSLNAQSNYVKCLLEIDTFVLCFSHWLSLSVKGRLL